MAVAPGYFEPKIAAVVAAAAKACSPALAVAGSSAAAYPVSYVVAVAVGQQRFAQFVVAKSHSV